MNDQNELKSLIEELERECDEILASLDNEVRLVVDEILKIERAELHLIQPVHMGDKIVDGVKRVVRRGDEQR
jgi:hypothetical protein